MKNLIVDFGAQGQGVASKDADTKAFAAAMAEGCCLYIPAGTYDVPVVWTKPALLTGDGAGLTKLIAPPGMTPLTIQPDPNFSAEGWGLLDLTIISLGAPALHIDTTAPHSYLARFRATDLELIGDAGTSPVLVLDNPMSKDGLFCSTFERGVVKGGIELNGAGDSIAFRAYTLTGNGVGMSASFVPGASQFLMEGCNSTAVGGAVNLLGATQPLLRANQFEQTLGTPGAMVILTDCIDGEVVNNNLNSYGNCSCILIQSWQRAASRNIVRANSLAGSVHAIIGRATAQSPGAVMNAITNDNRFRNPAGTLVDRVVQLDPVSEPMWQLY